MRPEDNVRCVPAPTVVPWRGPTGARPSLSVPLPGDGSGRMPLLRGGRPLKEWRWVGCFGPEVMLCAASARIGILRVSWWAVWDRAQRTLAERTVHGRGGVEVGEDRVRVRDGTVEIDLSLDAHACEGIDTVSPHGAQYAWTRKRGGVPMRGFAAIGDRRVEIDARGVIDDSAGYHARHTAWRWSAGVGALESGTAVAWNLVAGLHDDPAASERSIWIEGAAHEVGPVEFAADLSGVLFAEEGALGFRAEAARARSERLVVVSSDYEQPFGTFTGELPGAGRLAEGWGVMERHAARW